MTTEILLIIAAILQVWIAFFFYNKGHSDATSEAIEKLNPAKVREELERLRPILQAYARETLANAKRKGAESN